MFFAFDDRFVAVEIDSNLPADSSSLAVERTTKAQTRIVDNYDKPEPVPVPELKQSPDNAPDSASR